MSIAIPVPAYFGAIGGRPLRHLARRDGGVRFADLFMQESAAFPETLEASRRVQRRSWQHRCDDLRSVSSCRGPREVRRSCITDFPAHVVREWFLRTSGVPES